MKGFCALAALLAVLSMQAGEVHVKNLGFDAKDATKFVQKAVDSSADAVVLDAMPSPWRVSSVTLKSNKRLVLKKGVALVSVAKAAKDRPLLLADGVTDVIIEGEEGASLGEGAGEAIRIAAAERVTVRRLEVSKCAGVGVRVTGDCGIRIEDCSFVGNAGGGLETPLEGDGPIDVTVSRCTFGPSAVPPVTVPACGEFYVRKGVKAPVKIAFEGCVISSQANVPAIRLSHGTIYDVILKNVKISEAEGFAPGRPQRKGAPIELLLDRDYTSAGGFNPKKMTGFVECENVEATGFGEKFVSICDPVGMLHVRRVFKGEATFNGKPVKLAKIGLYAPDIGEPQGERLVRLQTKDLSKDRTGFFEVPPYVECRVRVTEGDVEICNAAGDVVGRARQDEYAFAGRKVLRFKAKGGEYETWSFRLMPGSESCTLLLYAPLSGAWATSAAAVLRTKEEPVTWELAYADEFNGTELDAKMWSRIPCEYPKVDWMAPLSLRPDLVTVSGGQMHLLGVRNDDLKADPRRVLTGGVRSMDKFLMKYGKVEIRCKLEDQKGAWPALWMMPQYGVKNWPNDGEIDIVERLNSQPYAHHTVHTGWTYEHPTEPPRGGKGNILKDDWNVFGLEWTPERLVWTVNGKVAHVYPNVGNGHGRWPFENPFFMIIDMQLGGSWVGKVDESTLPTAMHIDWIRFYHGSRNGKRFSEMGFMDEGMK